MYSSLQHTLRANHLRFQAALAHDDLPPGQREQRLEYFSHPTPERILEWGKTYMPQAVPGPYGEHHPSLIQCLQLRGGMVVLVLPRGYGKTTITKIYIAYCIAYGLEPYIVYLEHDASTAESQLADIAKAFTQNPRILADYGDLRGARWQTSSGTLSFQGIRTRNPYARHDACTIRFAGINTMVRGTTFDFSRLTLAIINDPIKDSTEANSPTYTKKVLKKIKEDIGQAGGSASHDPLSLIVIGTKVSDRDVVSSLEKEPLATVYKIPAISGDLGVISNFVKTVSDDIPHIRAFREQIEGVPPHLTGKSLTLQDYQYYCDTLYSDTYRPYFKTLQSTWPGEHTLHDYVFRIARWGSAVFMQEMMHQPHADGFQKYQAAWFDVYSTLPADHEYGMGITIDLAGEAKDGSDPMVVLQAIYDYTVDDVYLLNLWCEQGTPADVVYTTYRFLWEMWAQYPEIMGSVGDVPIFLECQKNDMGQQALFEEIRQKEIALRHQPTYPDGAVHPKIYQDAAYWVPLHLLPTTQTKNKVGRLLDFRAVAEQHHIKRLADHPGHELLVTQAVNFQGEPTHKHLPLEFKIDSIDMLELFWQQMRGRALSLPEFSEMMPREQVSAPLSDFSEYLAS